MRCSCFSGLLTFVTITCCLGLLFSEAVADGDAGQANADDNTWKVGIGVHNTFPFSGISWKSWMSDIGIQFYVVRASMSVPTEKVSASLATVGSRFLITIQRKTRSRFYIGWGLSGIKARVKFQDKEEAPNGAGLEFVGGIEYSLSELPNFGIAFEFGSNLLRFKPTSKDSEDKSTLRFATFGTVGIHYYF